MRVVITGSSGRVGRAIFSALAPYHHVIGIDRTPFSTTHLVGDFADEALLRSSFSDADAIVHTAALHAPHVGTVPDEEFYRINVEGTRIVTRAAIDAGVKRLIFTSTTALYGDVVSAGSCAWIDEKTTPLPKSIYHRTKLEAESFLEGMAAPGLIVRILRMSRSFPEPGNAMAGYRLHRGVDIRDVADAHAAALTNDGPHFQRFIISAKTAFTKLDSQALATDAASVIRHRAPSFATEFDRRGWPLPRIVDRVYDSSLAESALGWSSRFGYDEVLAQLDRRSLEVLPVGAQLSTKPE